MISREERIELIRQVQEIRDRVEAVMAILVPEVVDGPCVHPAHLINDESTMGDVLFVCRQCGKSQDIPFVTDAGSPV